MKQFFIEVKQTMKSNSWMKGKKVFIKDYKKWRRKKRGFSEKRLERGRGFQEVSPKRGLIKINPRSYSFLAVGTLHHSRMPFVIFVAFGISFLLCTSRWKQCGNYTKTMGAWLSRFQRGDVVVKNAIRWKTLNLPNKMFLSVEHVNIEDQDGWSYSRKKINPYSMIFTYIF